MSREIKLALMGANCVGKTPLVIRYAQGYYVEMYDPTIEDNYRTSKNINGTIYILDILDTCGQEEYSAMTDQYIRMSDGFAVVYSIAYRSSFLEVENRIEQIHRVKDNESAPIVLVGNKCDLEDERQVSTEEGEDLADKYGIPFLETSAKTNHNVDKMFETLVCEVVEPSKPAFNNDNSNPDKQHKDCLIQ